ncbi:TIGR04104 family putative zinc finger protein [Bacillus sp. 1P06AnD]|uniref:TIGR04104 family putative zinc finger protein n=1 Tax=Bacillus sp. 1P06AnD TaxID=3132208 RepID=UPI00399EED9B
MNSYRGIVMAKFTCCTCGEKVGYWTLYRKLFTFKSLVICPKCCNTIYITAQSRKRASLILSLPLFINFIFVTFRFPFTWSFILLVGSCVIFSFILPFVCHPSSREEPLW